MDILVLSSVETGEDRTQGWATVRLVFRLGQWGFFSERPLLDELDAATVFLDCSEAIRPG